MVRQRGPAHRWSGEALVRLELTDQAIQVINAMSDRVVEIRETYGLNSPEYLRVSTSLLHALLAMLRLGGNVHRDDALSLYSSSWLDFGVNWTPDRVGDERHPLLGEWSVNS